MKKIIYLSLGLVLSNFGEVCGAQILTITQEDRNLLNYAAVHENENWASEDALYIVQNLRRTSDWEWNVCGDDCETAKQLLENDLLKTEYQRHQSNRGVSCRTKEVRIFGKETRIRSVRDMPEYMRFVQAVSTYRNVVCPTLHSYGGAFSTVACIVQDVKDDPSVANLQRRISAQLSPLGDLPNVRCALTVQPNRVARIEKKEWSLCYFVHSGDLVEEMSMEKIMKNFSIRRLVEFLKTEKCNARQY